MITHGFHGGYGSVEYQTIFPTRTIPFLLSGKPILVHSPPGSFLNDFIQEHKCAELVDEANEESIIAGFEKITNNAAYQKGLVKAAAKTAQLFYGPKVVQELRSLLQAVRD